MAKLAFIGLGVMGFPMAGHLSKAGHQVTVFNRNPDKAAQWLSIYNGVGAPTPAQAAEGAEFVCLCVGRDADVEEVTLGPEGVLSTMANDTILIDHTTASAELARRLYDESGKRGVGFLDAPVSGGQVGAQNGTLTIMVGGDQTTYDQAQPILAHYARASRLLGSAGAGQLAKMVNQIAIAGLVQALAEAVHFAQKAGLDGDAVFDVISKGAAGSWQMDNRHKTMLAGQFNFGFAVDWMRKDLGIVLDEASKIGATLPITALVDQFYGDVQAMGGARLDTSSLILRLQHFGQTSKIQS